jgi:hypothetical protein
MSPDADPRQDAARPIGVGRSSLRTWTSAAVLLVLAAALCFTVWYRDVYNVMPGQGASGRVHWCGRDYEYDGPTVTRQQAQAGSRSALKALTRRWPCRAMRFSRRPTPLA